MIFSVSVKSFNISWDRHSCAHQTEPHGADAHYHLDLHVRRTSLWPSARPHARHARHRHTQIGLFCIQLPIVGVVLLRAFIVDHSTSKYRVRLAKRSDGEPFVTQMVLKELPQLGRFSFGGNSLALNDRRFVKDRRSGFKPQ